MQFGAVNNAGQERTQLISTGLVPDPATDATLLITNPGVGRGIQIGEFPAIGNPTLGLLSSAFARGVWARADNASPSAIGVVASGRTGVTGSSSGSGGVADAGVRGTSDGINSNGVIGEANNGEVSYGVWGKSTAGLAGAFYGRVHVFGNLTKSGGGFQIDCPGRETDRYLRHSFVESSDMKNVYDGTAQLDEDGRAWIELPEWFGDLNRDYRYQLTAIGEAAPELHIAEEISQNRFMVAGGAAGMRVSWQVTGVRKDPWAEMNRIVVEQDKPESTRGTYLHPEAYGESETKGERYAREEALRSRRQAETSETKLPRSSDGEGE
jgi:hypothetical protein